MTETAHGRCRLEEYVNTFVIPNEYVIYSVMLKLTN